MWTGCSTFCEILDSIPLLVGFFAVTLWKDCLYFCIWHFKLLVSNLSSCACRGLSSHPRGGVLPLKQIYSPLEKDHCQYHCRALWQCFHSHRWKTGEPSISCQNAPNCVSNFKIFAGVTPPDLNPWGGEHPLFPGEGNTPLFKPRASTRGLRLLDRSSWQFHTPPWNKWLDKAQCMYSEYGQVCSGACAVNSLIFSYESFKACFSVYVQCSRSRHRRRLYIVVLVRWLSVVLHDVYHIVFCDQYTIQYNKNTCVAHSCRLLSRIWNHSLI